MPTSPSTTAERLREERASQGLTNDLSKSTRRALHEWATKAGLR